MDTTAIRALLQLYFDASFESDGEKMAKVFHDAAHIYGHGDDGSLLDTPKAPFVALISSFPLGSSDPAFVRDDEILSIDFTGENTAVARVRLRMGGIVFTDVLSLICIDGEWSVISKLYSGVTV
ncbi:MAG: nuclear transport factor 2 family protein [Oscillospiraceae bacterium]|nr:nuclear transport factor 2 family protein [Oscillospiraceae bacterium]